MINFQPKINNFDLRIFYYVIKPNEIQIYMKSFFNAKVKCNRVQEASVYLIDEITEIKVQYYTVRMTTYPRFSLIIQL